MTVAIAAAAGTSSRVSSTRRRTRTSPWAMRAVRAVENLLGLGGTREAG